MGNLTGDGEWIYSWQHGSQLSGMTKTGTDISYEYNYEGLRTAKTVNGITTKYFYTGDSLTDIIKGNNSMHFTYDAVGPSSVTYNGTVYYYLRNAQEDIVGIVDSSGALVVSYTYDAWGEPLAISGNLASTLGADNPFRYRGYIYDEETGIYYLNSRYYDPEIERFISTDSLVVPTISPEKTNWDKNIYAYCDNNPVVRIDFNGNIWETIFDVASLSGSIIEVAINPGDPWAWASLVGDTIDLIPFVTGVGETTRAVKWSRRIVNDTDNVVDAAKLTLKNAIKNGSPLAKSVGSYEILYKNGKYYDGKGGFNRAITSAIQHAKDTKDVAYIRWKYAPSARQAFIEEYVLQAYRGINNAQSYNKIWSPGKKYYEMLK